jgi:hypothetical protein
MKRFSKIALLLAIGLATGAPSAGAAVPIWLADNASFNIGPLPDVLCWNDAYYNGPNDYGDWTVGGPYYIDGNESFIWLRTYGQWARTTLDCLCTQLVVGFGSDSNDGVCEVIVDNSAVAVIDTWSNPGVYWYVEVVDLPYAYHEIYVIDNGDTQQLPEGNGADDVSIDGAGSLDGETAVEPSHWSSLKALY